MVFTNAMFFHHLQLKAHSKTILQKKFEVKIISYMLKNMTQKLLNENFDQKVDLQYSLDLVLVNIHASF